MKKIFFHPWRSPSWTYSPLYDQKYAIYSHFGDIGGYFLKGSNARGKVPKISALNTIMFLPSLGQLTCLAKNKNYFENSKITKMTHIWRYFTRRTSSVWNLPKKHNLRVVILNPPPPRFFYVFFYCSTGSNPMNTPFFVERQYLERVSNFH